MKPIVKLTATNVEKVDTLIILPEYSLPNFVGGCSKTVVETYHLIDDIIRFKDITTCVSLGNVLNYEKEIPIIHVEVVTMQPMQVNDSLLVGKQMEDQ